jgi:hypothetical protein
MVAMNPFPHTLPAVRSLGTGQNRGMIGVKVSLSSLSGRHGRGILASPFGEVIEACFAFLMVMAYPCSLFEERLL